MGLYDRYKTDPALEDEGAWVEWGDGVSFKIRRFKSKPVQDAKRRLERPYEADLKRARDLPEDIAKKLLVDQMSQAVVVDWKGVTDNEKQPMEFSVANATKLFTDLPDLMLEILDQSLDRDRFKTVADEDAAKN